MPIRFGLGCDVVFVALLPELFTPGFALVLDEVVVRFAAFAVLHPTQNRFGGFQHREGELSQFSAEQAPAYPRSGYSDEVRCPLERNQIARVRLVHFVHPVTEIDFGTAVHKDPRVLNLLDRTRAMPDRWYATVRNGRRIKPVKLHPCTIIRYAKRYKWKSDFRNIFFDRGSHPLPSPGPRGSPRKAGLASNSLRVANLLVTPEHSSMDGKGLTC